MPASLIPLCTPDVSGNEARYLQECITSGFVSSVGAFVDRLEADCAATTGATAAVAVASGTAALHVALVALGVRPGDLVAMPSFTFIATANAVSYCGAAPWLFDITADSWTMDPDQLASQFARDVERTADGAIHRPTGRRIGALLPVFTLGACPDMAPLVATARAHGIPVVGDAAAAIGAQYGGAPLATCGADLLCLSFNGNKTVTTGSGGAVVGNDADLLAHVRHLSTTARRGPDYLHDAVGFNYRMSNLEAAVGCAQLERLDAFVARKRAVAARYRTLADDLTGADTFPEGPWSRGSAWFSGLVLRPDGPAPEAVRAALRAAGIDARPFWRPIHLQQPYADAPRADSLAVSESIWERVIVLPCSSHLSDADLDHVVATVRGIAGLRA